MNWRALAGHVLAAMTSLVLPMAYAGVTEPSDGYGMQAVSQNGPDH
jgi:hypothetical protein